jgi:AraC-like DNA-binding protein
MNQSDAQIPVVYLFALSECMNDFGIDQLHWLRGTEFTKIDASFIESSINYQVFRELVLRALRLSNNKALGISVGHRLSLQSHGILGYAMMNCENLLSALKLLEQYISIRMPLMHITTYYQDNKFVVQFNEKSPLNDLRVIIIDAVLVAVKSAIDQIMPSLKKDLTLCFPYARHKNVPYGSLSECTLLFNEASASIQFPQNIMDKPVPLANLAAYMEAEMLCAKELTSLSHETTYKSRIKQKLLESTEQFPAQTVIASWFNMTSRTLHRRLVIEGTSYREILEEVKQSLAITYLSNSTMTIKEVSYFLGYDDVRNFSRAFRRWEGMSPAKYRQKSETGRLDL